MRFDIQSQLMTKDFPLWVEVVLIPMMRRYWKEKWDIYILKKQSKKTECSICTFSPPCRICSFVDKSLIQPDGLEMRDLHLDLMSGGVPCSTPTDWNNSTFR